MYVVLVLILLFLLVRARYIEKFVGMKIVGSILSHKNLVVRRTTRPQFLVVLTYFLVAEDARTLEFCYPAIRSSTISKQMKRGPDPLKQ